MVRRLVSLRLDWLLSQGVVTKSSKVWSNLIIIISTSTALFDLKYTHNPFNLLRHHQGRRGD